ncbi:Mrr restriction system protein [Corynebacterium provencense]|uniref:Mrr restriction system protein n=1 Tax=Corynebacterium provencense TaxID=1737425 RepID=A0A2Z3YWU3_9CORY|nr:restriction endonuclease [Corynebacterium provencense]AWT27430.1 Mrr restriction system protein [Corynebacterium provencense]
MSIPNYQGFMIPLLRILSDGTPRKLRDLRELVADAVGLTAEDRRQVLNSGQVVYHSRIGWAASYLSTYGAVSKPERGIYAISEAGQQLLAENPESVTTKELVQFAEAHGTAPAVAPDGENDNPGADASADTSAPGSEPLDPVEQIEDGVQRLNASIADELLTRLHDNDPAFFEQAVLDLLIAMGYGGAEGRATRTQLSNDGGIDGVIDQDALGLSRIYVQAKRYAVASTVGRPDIQAFVGALQGAQANQGVFLTTGKFSRGASQYADAIQSRVVLIDGERLTRLMIRYGVGVQVERTVEIVKIDEDFFE